MISEQAIYSYAVTHYLNPNKTEEEFISDYNLTLRIKKLLNRHLSGDDINFRLMLNNFMMFYNVFDPIAGTVILFAKLPEAHYPFIKTIAAFLNFLPQNLDVLEINLDDIHFDEKTINFLREI